MITQEGCAHVLTSPTAAAAGVALVCRAPAPVAAAAGGFSAPGPLTCTSLLCLSGADPVLYLAWFCRRPPGNLARLLSQFLRRADPRTACEEIKVILIHQLCRSWFYSRFRRCLERPLPALTLLISASKAFPGCGGEAGLCYRSEFFTRELPSKS